MAMSSDTAKVTDRVAALSVTDAAGPSGMPDASNGVRNGAVARKTSAAQRPQLSGRKMSLQERGTYLSAGSGGESGGEGGGGGGGGRHISPRGARRPTIESKRISFSDSQVGAGQEEAA